MEDLADTDGGGRRKRQVMSEFPKHITYKIRMDIDNVMNTNRLKSGQVYFLLLFHI